MKKTRFWSILMLVMLSLSLTISCGSDDDEDLQDTSLQSAAVGTWMCTKSTDSYKGTSAEGLLVGKQITIKNDGTYTSTSSNFGYSGTYSINGNTITAKNTSGDTFIVTVKINNRNMYWEGTASTGVTFDYTFTKE